MLAPDGRCKTLDAAAEGYVRAEAVGAIWLRCLKSVAGLTLGPNKPVSMVPPFFEWLIGPVRCMSQNLISTPGGTVTLCLVQAVVLMHGAALNQDGRSSSLTAPSGPAQQSLIRSALHTAHMPPSRVSPSFHGLLVLTSPHSVLVNVMQSVAFAS